MKLLGRLYSGLIESLATLAGLIVAGVCLLIVYDVIARNLGLQPPDSTVAITEYALLYFTMAAAPWLVRTRGHIVVEALHSRLKGHTRITVDWLILVICFFTSALIACLAAMLAYEAWSRGEFEIRSLAMPRALLFAPLTVGFGLMATEFLRLGLKGESVADPDNQKDAI
jgi:TRAP-type C4-dicarboxylate transport system permease small subunit